MTYKPRLNDYVKWTDSLGIITEGWVYFIDQEYFTIEIGVREKVDDLVEFHKKTHCLVLCHKCYWDEVKYIKCRKCHEEKYGESGQKH